VVAARDLKYAARVGVDAFLDILHPGTVHAHRHLVFGFARHRAGVAPDALAVIDYEAVFHPRKFSARKNQSYSDALEVAALLLNLLAKQRENDGALSFWLTPKCAICGTLPSKPSLDGSIRETWADLPGHPSADMATKRLATEPF